MDIGFVYVLRTFLLLSIFGCCCIVFSVYFWFMAVLYELPIIIVFELLGIVVKENFGIVYGLVVCSMGFLRNFIVSLKALC